MKSGVGWGGHHVSKMTSLGRFKQHVVRRCLAKHGNQWCWKRPIAVPRTTSCPVLHPFRFPSHAMFGQPLACLGGTVLGRQRGAQRVFFQLIGTALHGVDVPPTTRFKMKFASAVRGHVRKNGVDPLATEDADVMLMGLGRSVFCLEMVGRGVGDVGHVPQGAGEGGDGECGGRTCFGKHGWLVGC